MRTWEMIRELTEHPEKEFKRVSDGLEIRNIYGKFKWAPGYAYLGENDEWEEVKESVDFMTAVKSGKMINVKHELLVHHKYMFYDRLDLLMLELANDFNESDLTEI